MGENINNTYIQQKTNLLQEKKKTGKPKEKWTWTEDKRIPSSQKQDNEHMKSCPLLLQIKTTTRYCYISNRRAKTHNTPGWQECRVIETHILLMGM